MSLSTSSSVLGRALMSLQKLVLLQKMGSLIIFISSLGNGDCLGIESSSQVDDLSDPSNLSDLSLSLDQSETSLSSSSSSSCRRRRRRNGIGLLRLFIVIKVDFKEVSGRNSDLSFRSLGL